MIVKARWKHASDRAIASFPQRSRTLPKVYPCHRVCESVKLGFLILLAEHLSSDAFGAPARETGGMEDASLFGLNHLRRRTGEQFGFRVSGVSVQGQESEEIS